MAVTPFIDFQTVEFIVLIMFIFDVIGYKTRFGTFYVISGLLGVFTLGSIFTNQYVIQSSVFASTWQANKVDPNVMALIVAVVTIGSFLFVYFEREASGD